MLIYLTKLDSLVRPMPDVVGVHLFLSAKHISKHIFEYAHACGKFPRDPALLPFSAVSPEIRWLTPRQTSVKQLGHIEQ